jgi:hypothetical protein
MNKKQKQDKLIEEFRNYLDRFIKSNYKKSLHLIDVAEHLVFVNDFEKKWRDIK